MARAIDADALLKDSDKREGAYGLIFSAEDIRNAPTIEAEPVKHGKWNAVPNKILIGGRVATQGTAWECSACNNSSKQYLPTMKHCPNCGARMDGDQK